MRTIVLMALLAVASSTFAERSDTFRGHVFYDDHTANFQGLRLEEVEGKVSLYSMPDDPLVVGEAKLNRILYGFYKDRFYCVSIDFDGQENFDAIKETLRQKYGYPEQPNQFMPVYIWRSLWRGVTIMLEYKELTRKGSVVYQSDLLDSELKRDSEKAAKEAVGGL